MTKQAKHMRQNGNQNGKRGKAHIVALALAGVLALGGAGALCISGLGQSPGQTKTTTTAVTQQTTPKKAETKQETKQTAPKQAETKQTETKKAEAPKQEVKQAETKKETPKQETKQAETKQTQQQATPQKTQQQTPTTQQTQQQTSTPASENDIEAAYSKEQCIAAACAYVGAGGQAKGPALNVSAQGPITGGGTKYYNVELDLGDVHYLVMVDAVSGQVVSGESSHAGTRNLLDDNGNPIEGTETPAAA